MAVVVGGDEHEHEHEDEDGDEFNYFLNSFIIIIKIYYYYYYFIKKKKETERFWDCSNNVSGFRAHLYLFYYYSFSNSYVLFSFLFFQNFYNILLYYNMWIMLQKKISI